MCSDVQPEQSDEPVDENEDLVNNRVNLLDEDLDGTPKVSVYS